MMCEAELRRYDECRVNQTPAIPSIDGARVMIQFLCAFRDSVVML